MPGTVGNSGLTRGEDLLERILAVLASIEACDLEALKRRVAEEGLEGLALTSHQIVHILVELQDVTGVDPEDPEVLKNCNPQTLRDLIEFLTHTESSS